MSNKRPNISRDLRGRQVHRRLQAGTTPPRALRSPDHGRPYDWPYRDEPEHRASQPPSVEVEPSGQPDDVALWGPDGQPLRFWTRQIGYRPQDDR